MGSEMCIRDSPPPSPKSKPDNVAEGQEPMRLGPPLPPVPVLPDQLGQGETPPPNPPPSLEARPDDSTHVLGRNDTPPPPPPSPKATHVNDSGKGTPPPSGPST